MNKQEIIYVGGFRLPAGNASAMRAIDNSRILSELGYTVHLGGVLSKDKLPNIERVHFFDYTISKHSLAKKDISIEPIIEHIDKVGKKAIKAIIAYNYGPIAFYRLLQYCKKERINLIPETTEWYSIDGKLSLDGILRYLMHQWRLRWLNRRCKHHIVISSYLKKKYNKGNVLMLPPLRSNINILKTERSKENDSNIRFVYAGNTGLYFCKDRLDKCIRLFANLSERYSNFTFDVIGLTKEQTIFYDSGLEERIDKLGSRIKFHGKIPHPEARNVLVSSDIVVFLRPYNLVSKAGFPSKVREAFDHNLIVFTNDTSDLKKYILDKKSGFLVSSLGDDEVEKKAIEILNLGSINLNSMRTYISENNPFDKKHFLEDIKIFFSKIE